MPIIEVDDEVCDRVARYAKLWGQGMGEAVATLIRLFEQPDHSAARPCGPIHGDIAGEERQ